MLQKLKTQINKDTSETIIFFRRNLGFRGFGFSGDFLGTFVFF